MVRALGAGGTRRGFVGLLAALAAGGAVAEADAKRRCRRDSPAGQCCRKKGGIVSCTCLNGGTVCGTDCCLVGQECEGGRCVEMPEPVECIAYGEPCKNVGRPCCENLVCGSGQGGQDDVACYVRKTGRCASTAECVYGTECVDGICIVPLPVPTPTPGPTCVAANCTNTCAGGGVPAAAATRVCLGDECGCACANDGGFFSGVSCSPSNPCTNAACTNMLTGGGCPSDSAFCCCDEA